MKIYEAMLAMQKELKNPALDGIAKGTFSYKYATLPAILEAVRAVASKCNLVVVQDISCIDGKVGVCTVIAEAESGERLELGHIETSVPKESRMNEVQALGSVITYLRRYSILASLGIAGEEDTDTQEIDKPGQRQEPPKPAQRQEQPKPAPKPVFSVTDAIAKIKAAKTLAELKTVYDPLYRAATDKEREELAKAKDETKERLNVSAKFDEDIAKMPKFQLVEQPEIES